MEPADSVGWVESAMIPFYALGEIKNELADVAGKEAGK